MRLQAALFPSQYVPTGVLKAHRITKSPVGVFLCAARKTKHISPNVLFFSAFFLPYAPLEGYFLCAFVSYAPSVSYAQKGYKLVKIVDFKSILLFSNRRFAARAVCF